MCTGVRPCKCAVAAVPQRSASAVLAAAAAVVVGGGPMRSMGTGEGSRLTGASARERRKAAAMEAAAVVRALWASLGARAAMGAALSQAGDLGSLLVPPRRVWQAEETLGGKGFTMTRPARA